jgi:hypothetical protein
MPPPPPSSKVPDLSDTQAVLEDHLEQQGATLGLAADLLVLQPGLSISHPLSLKPVGASCALLVSSPPS